MLSSSASTTTANPGDTAGAAIEGAAGAAREGAGIAL